LTVLNRMCLCTGMSSLPNRISILIIIMSVDRILKQGWFIDTMIIRDTLSRSVLKHTILKDLSIMLLEITIKIVSIKGLIIVCWDLKSK